jgi:hypothetical protein
MPALARLHKTLTHILPRVLTCQHAEVSDKVGTSGCNKGMAVRNDDAFQAIDADGSCIRPDDRELCRIAILSLNWAVDSAGWMGNSGVTREGV